MASILKRERKNGTTAWQVQTRVPGQSSICKTFNDEAQARHYAVESDQKAFSAAGREKRFSPSSFYNESFSEVMKSFLLSDESNEGYRRKGASIIPHLKNATLGQITPNYIKTYVKTLQKTMTRHKRPYKPSTLAGHLSLMSLAYAWYGREYNISASPDLFTTKHLPKGWNDSRERRLSKNEEKVLMAEFSKPKKKNGPFWCLLIQLTLETGARLQELIFAQWSEFDRVKHVWTIPKGHTKCKRTRYVPLSVVASEVLDQLDKLRTKTSDRPFHCFLIPQRASMVFSTAIKITGIPDFHFHDLRHEAISRMVLERRSMTVYEIMKIVGHNSIQMLDRYTHLRSDEMVSRFRET